MGSAERQRNTFICTLVQSLDVQWVTGCSERGGGRGGGGRYPQLISKTRSSVQQTPVCSGHLLARGSVSTRGHCTQHLSISTVWVVYCDFSGPCMCPLQFCEVLGSSRTSTKTLTFTYTGIALEWKCHSSLKMELQPARWIKYPLL